mgnify:CR=1 FL=1
MRSFCSFRLQAEDRGSGRHRGIDGGERVGAAAEGGGGRGRGGDREDPDGAFQTAAGTQDGAAIAKLFAPDGVEMPPNAPAAKGRAAIEAFHKAFGQQYMMHGMTIDEQRAEGAAATRPMMSGPTSSSLMAMKERTG